MKFSPLPCSASRLSAHMLLEIFPEFLECTRLYVTVYHSFFSLKGTVRRKHGKLALNYPSFLLLRALIRRSRKCKLRLWFDNIPWKIQRRLVLSSGIKLVNRNHALLSSSSLYIYCISIAQDVANSTNINRYIINQYNSLVPQAFVPNLQYLTLNRINNMSGPGWNYFRH